MTRSFGPIIRKAVIPVAGLGVRMLPITKVLPKGVVPNWNKPVIQYAIEEAMAIGVEEVILITRTEKSILEQYFAPAPQLEQFLQQHDRESELALVRSLSSSVQISTVSQS